MSKLIFFKILRRDAAIESVQVAERLEGGRGSSSMSGYPRSPDLPGGPNCTPLHTERKGHTSYGCG